jgi:hypothetical protein
VRRNAVLITLLSAELFVAGLAAFFYLKARVSVLAAFQDFGTPIPALTRLALSTWALPIAVGVSLVLSLIALAGPLRRSLRHGLAGAGLVIASIALVVSVWAAFAPLFQPGD